MSDHDVVNFVNGLSAKLATRSRHVCAFLGAGASRACGLPDMVALQTQIAAALEGAQRSAFEHQISERNLEQVLSRLRRIAALVDGDDTVDGLTGVEAAALDAAICRQIVAHVSIDDAVMGPALGFAAWAARADYRRPLELFTVNYDLLLESALEQLGIPYFDGFVGTLRGRFRTELVEAEPRNEEAWLPRFVVRLWKLHGSVNWVWETGARAEVVRLGTSTGSRSPAAIYPSDTKYDESRRVPFVVLQDRLRRALQEPETLLLVSGYSWADEHLNEMLFDAATRRPRSELVAFCYTAVPQALAERATTTPNLQVVAADDAILGGVRAAWAPPQDPVDVWRDGALRLGDFAVLASFLARSSSPRGELETRLAELLAKATEETGG